MEYSNNKLLNIKNICEMNTDIRKKILNISNLIKNEYNDASVELMKIANDLENINISLTAVIKYLYH